MIPKYKVLRLIPYVHNVIVALEYDCVMQIVMMIYFSSAANSKYFKER